MMRKLLLLFAFLGFTYGAALAQTGKLAGKVLDKTNKEPIAFGAVVLKLNGAQKAHGTTDIDGAYSITGLTPGSYSVEITYLGYNRQVINGVVVSVDKTTALNIDLSPSDKVLDELVVTTWREPIIGPEKVGQTLTSDQIKKIASVDVGTLASTAAGATSADAGRGISLRGSRTAGTVYYVNGVKQLVTPTLSPNSIAQMTVISGGQPAQYGDAAGGVINITTSSPSANFQGGIEGETSTFLDKYNNNRINFSLTGPIWTKRDASDSTKNRSILGFFLSGQYQNSKDDSPSAQGVYSLKDASRKRISDQPFLNDPQGGYSVAAQQITMADMEKGKVRENVGSQRFNINTSFDFQPKENIMITFGGLFNRSDRNMYVNSYSLFNAENNPQQIINNWNAYIRFQQFFRDAPGDSSSSAFKNAYYQIQADYSKYDRVIQNERLKDNVWRYGYIGKFNTQNQTFYQPVSMRVPDPNKPGDSITSNVLVDMGDYSTNLTFENSGDNPYLARYTEQVLAERNRLEDPVSNIFDLALSQGVLNGGDPNSVYSMYANRGSVYPLYALLNNDQFRLSALGSAELGKHTFKLGFEFEQRVETNYSIDGTSLWTYGRAFTFSDTELDLNNATPTYDETGKLIRLDYGTKAIANQSTFGKNLRNKLGLQPGQPINIDAISPEDLSVSMFSADELINPDIVNYQGYTYDGKRTTKRVSFEDFFSDPINRPQDAVRPIYAAAFIEDKFQIEDLTLRAGLRVDRYDANQKVLKDPYSLVDLMHAKDLRNLTFANGYNIPSNIGDDYVVYVDKNSQDFSRNSSTNFAVTGYRKGDTFYDVDGTATENTNKITENGAAYPLFDPALQGNPDTDYLKSRGLSVKAFKDYEPQIYVMPRLSFSFPISEDALFFAHYDILTQRPERNGTLPSDYYFLYGSIGSRNEINNPDLKLQKTIDYEVGFEQRLTQSSGLTISAFYKEMRDQVSYRRYVAAYPQDYVTFSNLDFGTVKGMTMEFDLRRTGNIALTASYTLQFAKGTGSSATSGYNLASQGIPNLRTPIPLDFDQRHGFKVNLDYRFFDGEGPLLFDKTIFQNTGINFTVFAGSGTPYSRQANITNYINAIGRPVLEGTMNGSRLPANYRADLRIDKDFKIGKTVVNVVDGQTQEKFISSRYVKSLNVFFRVENVFNRMNVLNVYRYTGSAEDDGYLASYQEKFGEAANQSLMDIYMVRMLNGTGGEGLGSNPTNYSLPRRAVLGVSLTF
ncbi:TonB-dependent receptor [Adhaeribacter soli]|uniref:TonB-dependent receptor plug domain-containing protein n=1 Tax=Adhaeribacter soli TaxID=2607655 RepID=A0A5N1J8L2_9BACT|nr:TonB-dependent receptor [Adhaeribacter soli]KAA9345625.1 TonB-dependent receptor plug domain-containing protein [Adhaeribacter soli]